MEDENFKILDKKLDEVLEICRANGEGIEVLSNRVDKIEEDIKKFFEIA